MHGRQLPKRDCQDLRTNIFNSMLQQRTAAQDPNNQQSPTPTELNPNHTTPCERLKPLMLLNKHLLHPSTISYRKSKLPRACTPQVTFSKKVRIGTFGQNSASTLQRDIYLLPLTPDASRAAKRGLR